MKKNATRSVGRPEKPIKYPRSIFTIATLVAFNAGNLCALSVRSKVSEAIDDGTITKLDASEKKDGPGRPSDRFILTNRIRKVRKTKRNRKTTSKTPAATPVASTPVTPAPTVTTPTVPAPVAVAA